MVQGETHKNSSNNQNYLWTEIWIGMSKAAQKEEKQGWSTEKPKLDNARTLRGIYFIDPEDEEYKEPIKDARKKLEVPMEAATHCKMEIRKRARKPQETVARRSTDANKKTEYACIVEAHESTRKRLEFTLPRNQEDHIADKGFNSINHYSLVHKFIPMPQAMKIPGAAVDKERKKLETIPAWQLDKIENKKDVILEAQRDKRKVHFATMMDIGHLKNSELEPHFQKITRRVVLRGDIVKDDSGAYAALTEQGSSASKLTAAKVIDVIARLPDCDGQAADAVSAYAQVKMKDAPRLLKKPKSECPDIWIRLPRHNWPKSWTNIEDPIGSS